MDALLRALPAGVTLARRSPPTLPELTLHLLDETCLDRPLVGPAQTRVFVEPPYWALAWASGQALARYLLDRPELVANKRVLDFGTGSGLVAIAAKRAGAREVVGLDRDPRALEAAALNAEANDVALSLRPDLDADARFDVVVAADVLYVGGSEALLARFTALGREVWLAESRFSSLPSPRYAEVFAQRATTYPDIDEPELLRYVRLFRAHA